MVCKRELEVLERYVGVRTRTAVRTLEAGVRTVLEQLRQVLEQLASWTVLTPGWPSC